MVYRFIQNNYSEFGLRWLLRKFKLSPNAYYNFKKDKKSKYRREKSAITDKIAQLYHDTEGVIGHRKMRVFLERQAIKLSKTTVHKYMNKQLGLKSVVRRKKPGYVKGHAHKIFPNLLNQNFTADYKNSKWCTDFTYLFLTDGSKHYNCSIIDLYDRSVVASINGKEITSDLAIRTVKKAIDSQPTIRNRLLLHSDQGSQFTSKEFVGFCNSMKITQSMSKAGYPYDNAPMERYYNTLKNEKLNLHYYHSEKELDQAVSDFAYIWYNHIRPHSYNNNMTPFEARFKDEKSRLKCYKNA
jgi:putative transposase